MFILLYLFYMPDQISIHCDLRSGKCSGYGIDNAVYVGDTAGDESAARYAGIPFVWAAYGFGKAKAPDGVIQTIGDLANLLLHRKDGKIRYDNNLFCKALQA